MSLAECWDAYGPCVVTDPNLPTDLYPPMKICARRGDVLQIEHGIGDASLRVVGNSRMNEVAIDYISNNRYERLRWPLADI